MINKADSSLRPAFERIRDERRTAANTATRIGNAFLSIIPFLDRTLDIFLSKIEDDRAEGFIEFMQGLKSFGTIFLGEYAEGLAGGKLTEEGYAELENLWVRTFAKFGDGLQHQDIDGKAIPALQVDGDSAFSGNLSSTDFVSAFFGGLGWAIQKIPYTNASGQTEYRYSLEIDNVTVRNALRVFEMIISQLLGENGNRFISDMMEVDHYDPSTGKVWLKTGDGKLYNSLRTGDIVVVQQYNGDPTLENDWNVTKAYEFRVTAVGIGDLSLGENRLDWLEFENFTSTQEGLTPELAFRKGDTLVRADNDVNPNRKGLITVMSVGENTPYIDVLYGMKTDPNHALKGRLGNLVGIRTNDFGQLQGFGMYTNNIYATGQFRNAQTGESLSAKIATTREINASTYCETTYDINEDDNHVDNGFFVRALSGWSPCTRDGLSLPSQAPTGLFHSGGTPLLVNGQLISVGSRQQAVMTEFDGIPMLKLTNAGVAQAFSSMKPNTTHKELISENSSETADIPDILYMGIRILPLTTGTLKVEFLKQSGTSENWQRSISDTGVWMTIQAHDTSLAPWDYTGEGRMIVSYTGQCMVRFVVLVNNPVASMQVDYWTRITQTSRQIKAEANAIYATRTMHSELSVEVGRIASEVTSNRQASDLAKQQIETRLGLIETFDNNTATWMTQTDSRLSLWAGSFDANGNVKGLAQLRLDVNGLTTTVGTLVTTAAMEAYVQSLQHDIDSIEADVNKNATAIATTNRSVNMIAASFNADGTVKTSGNIGLYIKNQMSFIDMTANTVNFHFDNGWNVFRGSNKVLWIDEDNNLCMVGDIKSGTVEASSVYIPCLDINNLSTYNYTIDPKHSPYRMFLGVGTYSQDLIVNLPSPTTYEGLELRFYSRSRTRSGAPMVLCGLIMYSTGTGLESANRVRIGWNELTVLLAFGGAWHVIIGSVEKIS
jgi:hypothetical protein